MSWPSPNAFREPEATSPVVTASTPAFSKTAIALSVSAMTLPLMGGLVFSRWALAGLEQLGNASEELFRGDRLPLLKNQPKDKP